MPKRKRTGGRPPVGYGGVKASSYPTITIRCPPEIRESMDLAVKALGLPLWRVLVESFQAYVKEGPPLSDRKLDEYKHRKRMKAKHGNGNGDL